MQSAVARLLLLLGAATGAAMSKRRPAAPAAGGQQRHHHHHHHHRHWPNRCSRKTSSTMVVREQQRRRLTASSRSASSTTTTTTTATKTPSSGSAEEGGGSGLSRVTPIAEDSADSGLEYHIKFPAAKYDRNRTSGPAAAAAAAHGDGDDEDRIPVVLLFGWAGCQDKYLAKYSKIYEDRGLITLRYIVPIRYLLWKRYHVIRIGQKLVKLLYDLNFDGHPIIVHCFSNGGAFLYQNFSMALENSPTTIQIKGVIFDSSPGRRRLVSLYKAISAILGGNCFYNAAMSFLFTLFCSIIWLWEVAQKLVCSSRRDLVADPFDRLRTEPHLWPQHFIYSEADALISHKDVEKFIRHRESIGVRVTALRYKSSPHVKHFSAHKESYEASVLAFVNECLSPAGGASPPPPPPTASTN